ncbi:MAG: uroporphyrin-3 C-methyltransferase [Gammaproteobacteria bacterium]|jgi:uroporphyrin-III C-methyltransferase
MMNDEAKSGEVDEADQPIKKSKSGSALGFSLVALMVFLSIGLSVWVYFQMDKLKTGSQVLASTLAPIEARLSSLEPGLAKSQQANQQFQNQIVSVQQQQQAISESVDALYRAQDRGNLDWALAEIEHLLIIATHLIQLQADVPTALAAMQAADDRLKNNNDPGLLPVRQQLTGDINALMAVDAVDISGLVLFLSDLVGRVHDLPLKQVNVTETLVQNSDIEEGRSTWKKFLSSVWRELKSLVKISRQGEQTLATLMPEQEYFLYQNLRLQLESARYAVLRRDTENLHVSVEIVSAWLKDYFNVRDNGVSNILESLSKMEGLELNPVLPDISSSLESIRAYAKLKDSRTQINQQMDKPAVEDQTLEQEP